ncbi:MAG TPA: hypothetical protein VFU35_07180 [Jatrophihabitans sp.]|nr:hypothetical protein [Jatrophihabitans sp.]
MATGARRAGTVRRGDGVLNRRGRNVADHAGVDVPFGVDVVHVEQLAPGAHVIAVDVLDQPGHAGEACEFAHQDARHLDAGAADPAVVRAGAVGRAD